MLFIIILCKYPSWLNKNYRDKKYTAGSTELDNKAAITTQLQQEFELYVTASDSMAQQEYHGLVNVAAVTKPLHEGLEYAHSEAAVTIPLHEGQGECTAGSTELVNRAAVTTQLQHKLYVTASDSMALQESLELVNEAAGTKPLHEHLEHAYTERGIIACRRA